MSLGDQMAYLQSRPPRLLAPFGFERIEHSDLGRGGGHGETIVVHYAVSCLCGSSQLTLFAVHHVGKIDVAPKEEGWSVSISGEMTRIWLDCRACGARHINVGGQMMCGACRSPIRQPSPPIHIPEYREVTFRSSPVYCLCETCGRDEVLFDSSQHGHDAEFGYSESPAEGERRPVRSMQGALLCVSLYYSENLLDPDAPLERPEDYFSWVSFSRIGSDVESLIDFECA